MTQSCSLVNESLPNEVWKPIQNLDGYSISNFGRIRGVSGCILKAPISDQGYRIVTIYRKRYRVARLVATHFIPTEDLSFTVEHGANGKLDDSVNNLSWMSLKDNINNAFKNGLMPYDRALQDEDIPDICFLALELKRSYSEIGRRYGGLNPNTIRQIVHRLSYKHVTVSIDNYTDKLIDYESTKPNPNSPLTYDQIVEIKRLILNNTQGTVIAKQFGISSITVNRIKHGRTYSDIPWPEV